MTKSLSNRSALTLSVFLAAVAGGCAGRYDITLSNGDVITARSKPKANANGQLEFKDGKGQLVTIPPGRVRMVERR